MQLTMQLKIFHYNLELYQGHLILLKHFYQITPVDGTLIEKKSDFYYNVQIFLIMIDSSVFEFLFFYFILNVTSLNTFLIKLLNFQLS
ncbi:hypothetical protein C0J52_25977 [Blattella germanica]|nr:hypothetical protein C0J52_25977 [Blattella germanica]